MSDVKRLVTGRNLWVVPCAGAVIVLLAPWLGVGAADTRKLLLVALLTMSASGLNLAWGYGGQLAVGQLAAYAMGAYVSGWMSLHGYDLSIALVVSALAAAALGFVTGLPSLRFGGWGLVMASFFLIILIPNIVKIFEHETGGLIGMLGIKAPVLFGVELTNNTFYLVVMVCCIAWLAVMRNLVLSRHGSALRVMRESPVLAASLGINVKRLKLSTYVLGAIPAGIAGGLFAFVNRFVAPESFSFEAAVLIIAVSVIGGLETVYGAIIGATILTLGPDEIASFNEYAEIIYGIFLIVGGMALANTRLRSFLTQSKRRARTWRQPPPTVADDATVAIPPIEGVTLRVDGVSKAFGGVRALDSVNLEAKPGEITALIGANGSGKTTLLNIICGYYSRDVGEVLLGDERLPSGRPVQSARMGVARTFQTPIAPRSMTTAEAVSVARYARDRCGFVPAMLRLPKYRRIWRRDSDEATQWLSATGLLAESQSLASTLPLGNRRLLEVARALAAKSRVLLLDEVASGLGVRDIEVLADLLRRIRAAGATIILVEHNFGLVNELADTIYVLERGAVIAHGTPEQIRTDPAVARSYLGELAGADLSVEEGHVDETVAQTVSGRGVNGG